MVARKLRPNHDLPFDHPFGRLLSEEGDPKGRFWEPLKCRARAAYAQERVGIGESVLCFGCFLGLLEESIPDYTHYPPNG